MDSTSSSTSINDILALKGKKIVFLNIRMLLPDINNLRLDFELSNVLAVWLNETWLNVNISDSLIKIEGFKLFRLDRTINKRGGGGRCYLC